MAQALTMDKTLSITTQCKHYSIVIVINYQNHTWRIHALSISPILVIDDKHFERVYNMEIKEQEPVALTSNTTKVCDVSPITYIEQTPPQSMHVCINMNSLHILPTITGGGVSSIYQSKQQSQLH